MEMIGAILYQLTRNIDPEKLVGTPFGAYFVDHTAGVYPSSATGVPFDNKYTGVKGDAIADLNEDLAAEQKARVTYDNILRMVDDPDVRDPIKFLREREIVHYQRFAERVQSRWNGCGVADKNRIKFRACKSLVCLISFKHIINRYDVECNI